MTSLGILSSDKNCNEMNSISPVIPKNGACRRFLSCFYDKFRLSCFRYGSSQHKIGDKHLRNRMKLCALAICLMWLSSLRVAVYFASFAMEIPTFHLLYKSCKGAFLVTLEERDQYSRCASVQIDQCFNTLETMIGSEKNRANQSSLLNSDTVLHARQSRDQCNSVYISLQQSLETWVNNGQSLPFDNTTCSLDDQHNIMRSLGGYDAALSVAYDLSEKFTVESQDTVQRLTQYAKRRAVYDETYIDQHTKVLQNKLHEYIDKIEIKNIPELDLEGVVNEIRISVDSLLACTSIREVSKGNQCQYFKGAQEHVEDVYDKFIYIFERYHQDLNIFFNRVQAYKNNVMQAYQVSSNFYFGVKNFLKKSYLDNLPLGSWFDVAVTDFLPSDVTFPKNLPNFKDMKIMSIYGIWHSISPALDKFNSNLTAAIDKAYVLAKGLADDVELNMDPFPDFLPDDYNPPSFKGYNGSIIDVETEKNEYFSKSEDFVAKSAASLKKFTKMKRNFELEEYKFEALSVDPGDIQSKISNIDVSFEKLFNPSLDFDLWFLRLGSIGSLFFMTDFVFRLYFTIRLCFKYWEVGSISLPSIEMRAHKKKSNLFNMSFGELFLHIITNPFFGVFVAVLVATWVLFITSSLYIPLYEEYVSGCVPMHGNGTFLTKNAQSIAYNLAYQDGSRSLIEGIDSFDLMRSKSCNLFYISSISKKNEDSAKLQSLIKSQEIINKQMNKLRTCIDIPDIDLDFRTACCNQKGYKNCTNSSNKTFDCPLNTFLSPPSPFLPPGDYMQEQSCQNVFKGKKWSLSDSVFDCNNLPSCDVTCKGPNKRKIRQVTKECGCLLEWFSHSMWLKGTITITVFILMNLSRIGFLEGIARIFWRRLSPEYFTVLSSYDSDGDPTNQLSCNQKYDQNTGDTNVSSHCVRKYVRLEVGKNVKKFHLEGMGLVIIALLLNIPWIFLIKTMKDDNKLAWLP